jgi:hypothetical protein
MLRMKVKETQQWTSEAKEKRKSRKTEKAVVVAAAEEQTTTSLVEISEPVRPRRGKMGAPNKEFGGTLSLPLNDKRLDPSEIPGKKGKTPGLVYGWFVAAMKNKYGQDFLVGVWSSAHMRQARNLLDMYGEDVTRKAVEYFVVHWEDMMDQSNGRLSGVPTIALLVSMSMRDWVFGQVQAMEKGKKTRSSVRKVDRKNSDEYIPDGGVEKRDDERAKVGW